MTVSNISQNDEWEYEEVEIGSVEALLDSGEYDIEVDSPDGYVPVTHFVNKGKKKIFKLDVDGNVLRCSAKHIVYTDHDWMLTEDLIPGKHKILIDSGKFVDFTISDTGEYEDVVDIRVDHDNHRYYTNNIVSHNTNMGKSLIMTAIAANMILQNKKILYVSLEMSEEKIAERIIANIFDININELSLIEKARFQELFDDHIKKLSNNLVIKQYPTSSANVNHLRNLMTDLKGKKNFVPDVVFVDYLGILAPIHRRASDNMYADNKRIAEEMRGFAVEYDLPVISAVQTNRTGASKDEIDLTHIGESFGVAGVADLIVAVTQSDELRKIGKYSWTLSKNRYGINGTHCMINVDYMKMRLSDPDDGTVGIDVGTIDNLDDVVSSVDSMISNDIAMQRDDFLEMDIE